MIKTEELRNLKSIQEFEIFTSNLEPIIGTLGGRFFKKDNCCYRLNPNSAKGYVIA